MILSGRERMGIERKRNSAKGRKPVGGLRLSAGGDNAGESQGLDNGNRQWKQAANDRGERKWTALNSSEEYRRLS
jgi:hypothetical protein